MIKDLTVGDCQQIDHTADIALRVSGRDIEDLFKTASNGWRQLTVGEMRINQKLKRDLNLSAQSLEELLVECLSELNYLFMGKQWLFGKYDKLQIYEDNKGFKLIAVIEGESLKNIPYRIETEIKAVTFHQLQIKEVQQGYETMIIFDI